MKKIDVEKLKRNNLRHKAVREVIGGGLLRSEVAERYGVSKQSSH
jgi:transposase